jgi:uncharacterized protein YqgQ
MLFYKNFIGVYNFLDDGGFIGFLTEISQEVEFEGRDIDELMENFYLAVDKFIKSQTIIKRV